MQLPPKRHRFSPRYQVVFLWWIGCVGFINLFSACREGALPNDHSGDDIRPSELFTDSISWLFREGKIRSTDYIALFHGENIFVSNPKVGSQMWIDSANTQAYDDSMRCLLSDEARLIQQWIWSLPEMNQNLLDNSNRGLHSVFTEVNPMGDSSWYVVQVYRDYFDRRMLVIPFGLLLVNLSTKEIIVRDAIHGDMTLDHWRNAHL